MLKPQVAERPPAPRCPSCASRNAHATGKTISDSTYWRCASCGEVWNPARRDSSPYAYPARRQ